MNRPPGADWMFAYGVATLAKEVLESKHRIARIYIPVGGGGLAAGIAAHFSLLPQHKRPALIGVQSENCCPVVQLIRHGSVSQPLRHTIADCISGDLEDGALITGIASDALDDCLTVTDDQLRHAVHVLSRHNVYVTPGAAAGLAGLLKSQGEFDETTCIL